MTVGMSYLGPDPLDQAGALDGIVYYTALIGEDLRKYAVETLSDNTITVGGDNTRWSWAGEFRPPERGEVYAYLTRRGTWNIAVASIDYLDIKRAAPILYRVPGTSDGKPPEEANQACEVCN